MKTHRILASASLALILFSGLFVTGGCDDSANKTTGSQVKAQPPEEQDKIKKAMEDNMKKNGPPGANAPKSFSADTSKK